MTGFNGRICTKCKEFKIFSEFHKCKRASSGFRERCKCCTSIENKGWKKKNALKCKEDNAKWYLKNTDKHKQKRDVYWASKKDRMKDWRLQKTYKINISEYDALLNKQNMCCAICERHQTEFQRRLAVDHDHETGEIRGLLCHSCNTGIGSLKDDYRMLDKASQYLKRSKIKLVGNSI